MTVSTTITRVAYMGDGSTTSFPITFPFFEAGDIQVLERVVATGQETAKLPGTHYTVAGGGGSTGTVTASSPPGGTVEWIIRRQTPRTQLIDYTSNDSFPAESHEKGLDRTAMRDQEMTEELARALQLPATDSPSLTTTLPSSVDRANRYLKFDASGNPVVAQDVTIGVLSLPVSIGDGGTGASNAAAARGALAAAGIADNNQFTGDNGFRGAFSIESTDAGAGEGPVAALDRLSATPAANDFLGALALRGRDSGGNLLSYAKLAAEIIDPADTSEDGRLSLQVTIAGTLATRAYVGAGVVVGSPTGADRGAGTINAQAIYVNGVPLSLAVSYAKLSYTVASGVNGGNMTSGSWQTLTLNTKDHDAGGIVTLASNQFTLGAGTYRIGAHMTLWGGGSGNKVSTRLRNMTDSTTTIVGSASEASWNGVDPNHSYLGGELTIAGSKTFQLQYRSTDNVTNGLGLANSLGENEVYRIVELWKVA